MRSGKNTWQWCVVVAYSGPFGEKDKVISKHRTYAGALRSFRCHLGGGYLRIKAI